MDDSELTDYISGRVKVLIRDVLKHTLKDPSMTSFLMGFSKDAKAASQKRADYQSRGFHVPTFLICSITNECNLRCRGCYAVSNGFCGSCSKKLLSPEQWGDLFGQSSSLGISFILLAGGEPLMRMPVVEQAARQKDIVFPLFTNGFFIPDNIAFFEKNKNIIPIISLDGPKELTDSRRGNGVYDRAVASMELLKKSNVFHGISATVTKENIGSVTDDAFIGMLCDRGCSIILFIEFEPSEETKHLALGDDGRAELDRRLTILRSRYKHTLFVSFPGDEKSFGGCLGAGRGFLHINPFGDVEACPFSPYHDTNLHNSTLSEAISSPLLKNIRDSEAVSMTHDGGCALNEHEDLVIRIVGETPEARRSQ